MTIAEGPTLQTTALGRADDMYGKGLDRMFPPDWDTKEPPIATICPWPQATYNIRLSGGGLYDHDAVNEGVAHPHFELVDPRDLYASQGSLTRAGVQYYLSGKWERSGKTFADDYQAGNRYPVVYRMYDGRLVILSGHHRFAAALLQGKPLRANVIESPQYRARADHPDALVGATATRRGRAPGDDRGRGRGDDRDGPGRRLARGLLRRGADSSISGDRQEERHPARGHREASGGYGPHLIARGLNLSVKKPLAEKIVNGTVRAQDFVNALMANGGLGEWWGIMGEFGDLVDFEDYAYKSLDPDLNVKGTWEEYQVDQHYGWLDAECDVVLVAKRPVVDGKPWDPDDNPLEMGGLMGNSYLPEHQPVELVEVRYDAGWGWKSLPATGIRAIAAVTLPDHPLLGDVSGLSEEAKQEIVEQLPLLPAQDVAVLKDYGVKIVGTPKAGREGPRTFDYGAVYNPAKRQVELSESRADALTHPQSKVLLHELGHAMDYAKGRLSQLTLFKGIWKDAKPTSPYFKGTGGGSPTGARGREEMFAEAYAATHGGYEPEGFTLTEYLKEIANEVHAVPHTASKTGMPSWRDYGTRPQAEALIAPDQGRSRGNSFEVFLYDEPHGHYRTLKAAQEYVEGIYGALQWEVLPGDQEPHFDRVHGDTTAFNDAKRFYVVRRLPRLGTTASVHLPRHALPSPARPCLAGPRRTEPNHAIATVQPLDGWRPHSGMFAPGQDHLDPRVFDIESEQMLPQVRQSVLKHLDDYWTNLFGESWKTWARVYLAGSGASYWWDSDTDLDLLVGVDLDLLRAVRPANKEVPDEQIVEHLNATLMALRPSMAQMVFEPGTRPFDVTYYCNQDSYDIENISPYAAYSLDDDAWIVHPPVLPADWGPDSIPEETWRKCEQAAREAEQVLSLPEPERTVAGTVLFDWVHEGRKASYSPHGGGWLDEGNVIYQYLSLHPEHLLRRLYLTKHPTEATAAEALEKTAGRYDQDSRRSPGPTPHLPSPALPSQAQPHRAATSSKVAAAGTFWRVHPEQRVFTPEDATSRPFYNQPSAQPEKGYSCFANPWHLYLYVLIQWAGLYDGTTVLRFPGEKVGTGWDGEDLAVPTGLPWKTTWGEFVESLPQYPLPPSPKFAPWVPQRYYGSWQALAERWQYLDQEIPAQDWLVQHVLGTKVAAAQFPRMYHLSATRNRASIQEHGLRTDPDLGAARQLVWLFATREDAAPYMPMSFGASRGDNDLWEVDTTGLEIIPDPDPGWPGLKTWAHQGPIGPERLRLVEIHTRQKTAAMDFSGFTPPKTTSCNQRSDAFVRWCKRKNIEAVRLSFTDAPGHKADHSAVLINGDTVVDWTYRQFDPAAPEPLVEPLQTYVKRWDDWGTDYYAGMILDSWKTSAKVATMTDPGVQAAVNEFLARPNLPGLTPWDAHDQCYEESQRFQKVLADHGVTGTIKMGYQREQFMGQEVITQGHVGVQVGDTVYDWTARQFDQNAPVPRIVSVREWEAQWPDLDARTSAKTASTTTVYRGVYIELEEEDYAGLPGSLAQKVLKGGKDATYGTEHVNLGVHWTTDKQVAQRFATPMTRYTETPTLGSDGWTVSVPVVITAQVSSADVVTDEQELRDAMVEGHGWTGLPSTTRLPEQEVLVRPGAPVQVSDIEALSPRSWKAVATAIENSDADKVQRMKADWKRIGGGLRAVAVDQGEVHLVLLDKSDPQRAYQQLVEHAQEFHGGEAERGAPEGTPRRQASGPYLPSPATPNLALPDRTWPRLAKPHHVEASLRQASPSTVVRTTYGEWDKALMHSLLKDGGFTLHDHVGDAPDKGYMVSVAKNNEVKKPLRDITADDIADYLSLHQQELRDPSNFLGGWTYKGNVYLDISRHVEDEQQAMKLARSNRQIGIFDLGSGETILTAQDPQ